MTTTTGSGATCPTSQIGVIEELNEPSIGTIELVESQSCAWAGAAGCPTVRISAAAPIESATRLCVIMPSVLLSSPPRGDYLRLTALCHANFAWQPRRPNNK